MASASAHAQWMLRIRKIDDAKTWARVNGSTTINEYRKSQLNSNGKEEFFPLQSIKRILNCVLLEHSARNDGVDLCSKEEDSPVELKIKVLAVCVRFSLLLMFACVVPLPFDRAIANN